MAFDPCREWLGIDALDLTDARRVLGLPPGRHPAEVVDRAAAARLSALASVAPGPFAKAHAAIVARVEAARDQLLAEAAPAATAAVPRMPPPPRVPPPAGSRPLEQPPPFPGGQPPAEWPVADEGPESAAEPDAGDPARLPDLTGPGQSTRVGSPRPANRRRRPAGSGGLLLASILLLGVAAAVLARQVVQSGAIPGLTNPARPAAGTQPRQTALRGEAGGSTPGGTGQTDTAKTNTAENRQRREQEARAAEARRQRAEAEESARREEEARMAAEEARRLEREEQERKRLEEENLERLEEERRRLAETLERSLDEAYRALQRQEFDTAERLIGASEKQVGDDVEAATRLERWRLFARYARDFATLRDRAFAAANEGRDYELDGTRFAVIEINPTLFIYKLAGKIERVPRERVDPRIEMAVVESWLAADGRAANHLFLGTHWLCLDPPDRPRARAAWRIAGNGGETVAPLMALLDDPVIRRAGR